MQFADRYLNRAQARAEYGPLADRYAALQLVGDPLADAAAAAIAGPAGRTALDAAIASGRSPIPALDAVLREAHALPVWVDFERMRAGARLQQRLGRMGMLILGAWSLVNSYHCGPAVKPLVFTGQLTRMANRRLAETSRYVHAVTRDDALRPGRRGWAMSIRVRLMHAMVRRMIRRSGAFDEQAWGVPINQADLVGTLIEFSAFIIVGARALGMHVSTAEAEGLAHLWRYAGYLNGVHPDLLEQFTSAARLERFAHLVHLIQPGPDADSVALTAALRATIVDPDAPLGERVAQSMLLRIHDGLSWALNVDDVAAELEVPNRHWRHVFTAARPLVRIASLVRRIPALDRRLIRDSNRAVEAELQRMLEGREPIFQARRIP